MDTHAVSPALSEWLANIVVHYPEPDYSRIEGFLANVEETASFLGELEVESDKDRALLAQLALAASGAASRIQKSMENVLALPKNVPWRQKAYDKFDHLLCRVEDIVETSALAANKNFSEFLQTEIQDLKDERHRVDS